MKQIWSCNDWLPSLLLSLPLPCKTFSFEILRCGHWAYLFSTSSNFLLTGELHHNYICKCSGFFPSLTLYMWERKIRLQSTVRDVLLLRRCCRWLQKETSTCPAGQGSAGEFRTSMSERQQENSNLANFKLYVGADCWMACYNNLF